MKFAIVAVVMCAFAMEVRSSIIGIPGLHINGLGAAGPVLQQGPIVIGWGASVPVASAAANVDVDVGSLVGGVHGATYVAKTRGAVHVAPLAGHTQSATSVNVDPAPGTW